MFESLIVLKIYGFFCMFIFPNKTWNHVYVRVFCCVKLKYLTFCFLSFKYLFIIINQQLKLNYFQSWHTENSYAQI